MNIIEDAIEELEVVKQDFTYQMDEKTINMAIRALKMQQKLAEYLNCSICEYWENYDWEENNISEYLPVSSVEDFIIDELKEEEE
jgi:hypothetical protein